MACRACMLAAPAGWERVPCYNLVSRSPLVCLAPVPTGLSSARLAGWPDLSAPPRCLSWGGPRALSRRQPVAHYCCSSIARLLLSALSHSLCLRLIIVYPSLSCSLLLDTRLLALLCCLPPAATEHCALLQALERERLCRLSFRRAVRAKRLLAETGVCVASALTPANGCEAVL